MKERPILFSGAMVRAVLAGTKTQTRRAMKPQPELVKDLTDTSLAMFWTWRGQKMAEMGRDQVMRMCPYGGRGDRLWVRESFDFLPSGGPDQPQACEIVYWASGSTEPRTAPSDYNPMIYGHQKVRPSIHMPRWASRILLEITAVRVERLQGISEADCIAEGVNMHADHHGKPRTSIYSPVQAYRDLWEQINGPDSWAANPWVWVIEFKMVEARP